MYIAGSLSVRGKYRCAIRIASIGLVSRKHSQQLAECPGHLGSISWTNWLC